jgi:hypothetical protein
LGGDEAKCSILSNPYDATDDALTSLDLSDIQKATVAPISEAVQVWNINMNLNSQGYTANLKIEKSIFSTYQSPVPSNQWQIEVENWHAIVMSVLQQRFAARVVGPSDKSAAQFLLSPSTPAESAVCGSHRVRIRRGFNNISLFGLLTILIVGFIFMVASLFLDILVHVISRLSTTIGERHKDWIHENVLHIQRVAYEGQSRRIWLNMDGDVPITKSHEFLAPL